MLRYAAAAAVLKLFSISPVTINMYGYLSSIIGKKRRATQALPKNYMDQAKFALEICGKYDLLQPNHTILEIGTGWMHWLSIILRLFYDVDICMTDVVDNRQFEAMRNYLTQFSKIVDKEISQVYARDLLQRSLKAKSFSELYSILGLDYKVNPRGVLEEFQDASFDVVISIDTLEHIHKDIIPRQVCDIYRVLKPGGYSVHQFDLNDHLQYLYARKAYVKNYLRYSDRIWSRYFENKVQYFNRIQPPEWIGLFNSAGFELVLDAREYSPIGDIKVDRKYEKLQKKDLECVIMSMIHRKPVTQAKI